MSFRPINENHAIAKVTFALHVVPNFTLDELEDVKNGHDSWKNKLPAIDKYIPLGLVPEIEGIAPPTPTPPVSFSSYKPDGNPEQKLLIELDQIFVECWRYSNWNSVWGNSRDLFGKVISKLNDDKRKVVACSLQYIDEFVCSSGEEFDAHKLLDSESEYIPKKFFNCGNIWHLHQGWFIEKKLPLPGRILERMHVTSRIGNDQSYNVQFENLNRYDILESKVNTSELSSSESGKIDEVFETLHEANKALLNEFLNSKISKRIGLV